MRGQSTMRAIVVSRRLPVVWFVSFLIVTTVALSGCSGNGGVALGTDDIGGVVTGPSGPEAGVWVIAETSDLPTLFNRIVVTDDEGRYVVPDLPDASYDVWVRGYGLVDSEKVQARPGDELDLLSLIHI